MTAATEARLEQIIVLSRAVETHVGDRIRDLAERTLADERGVDALTRVTTQQHEWEFYANGSFCRKCGAQIGSGLPCR